MLWALTRIAADCLLFDRQFYPRKLREAAFYIQRAATLTPQDAEVARLQRAIGKALADAADSDAKAQK